MQVVFHLEGKTPDLKDYIAFVAQELDVSVAEVRKKKEEDDPCFLCIYSDILPDSCISIPLLVLLDAD